jgi:hypothetical protein
VTGSGARIVPRLLPERPDEPVETVPAISGGHPSPRKNQRRLAMTPYLASRRDTREICEIPYLSGGEAVFSLISCRSDVRSKVRISYLGHCAASVIGHLGS